MDISTVLAWTTVLAGLVLSGTGVAAVFYFGEHHRALQQNWVLTAIYRTCFTITAVTMWLTLARAINLSQGPIEWLSPISGLFVVWLTLIPHLLKIYFKRHEGDTEGGKNV